MNTSRKQKGVVFVMMSGGVDSSVAALLLKERGFDVRGVHIKMWTPMESLRDSTGQADPFFPVCQQQYQDRIDAMRVAAHIGIPFETWDFTKEYREAVVNYMIREYAQGRTPNPDVMCNREIKFGIFLKRAVEMGAEYVATGHYTKLQSIHDAVHILRAHDNNKDQSYFLWTLTQEQLKHCLFPIGEYMKPDVRDIARTFGLPTAEKRDSQGICFIGEIDVREFLKKYIPVESGMVRTTSGRVIGSHEGLSFYTVGQREGLGIGGGIPYYVADKDFETNTLIVAEGPYDEKLFSLRVHAINVNWISGNEPQFPIMCEARIRYRQQLQKCSIRKLRAISDTLQAIFDEPQRAVTPGQSIVFYRRDEMLGGGIIAS